MKLTVSNASIKIKLYIFFASFLKQHYFISAGTEREELILDQWRKRFVKDFCAFCFGGGNGRQIPTFLSGKGEEKYSKDI